ncbi:MAG: hypothetical protein IPH07_34735 [Deltaproteobacteria bacterium]|nr:hypothetical protein [Deltaproteobacteria bacterium]MBK8235335.1 hypothetical protein [Deltaproteobacteria bacterium]MBK8716343.1 hypothetical protein [Deltaproteobacteria bacterium]MBP7287937.1 hypothetical protein [Nannocystaceae bacterium]
MVSVDRDGDFNFALLMFGVVAVAGYAAFAFDPVHSLAAIAIALVVALVYLLGAVFVVLEQSREDAFRGWLLHHAAEIRDTGVLRDGIVVRLDTELVTFPIGVGMLLLRLRATACPRVATASNAHAGKTGAMLITGVTGWWSLFGVLHTPFNLLTSLRGGERCTVREYLTYLQDVGVVSRWRARGDAA